MEYGEEVSGDLWKMLFGDLWKGLFYFMKNKDESQPMKYISQKVKFNATKNTIFHEKSWFGPVTRCWNGFNIRTMERSQTETDRDISDKHNQIFPKTL